LGKGSVGSPGGGVTKKNKKTNKVGIKSGAGRLFGGKGFASGSDWLACENLEMSSKAAISGKGGQGGWGGGGGGGWGGGVGVVVGEGGGGVGRCGGLLGFGSVG